MSYVGTCGEIMARLASPGHLRLRQTRALEVTYAGAEASVAASVCNFGGQARYVTALPTHALAEAERLKALGAAAFATTRAHLRSATVNIIRSTLDDDIATLGAL